jgi:outer membrane protein OmpA-like peptidoglycan-associated protein
MRFTLFFLFLLVWSVFWWWRYTCHIKQACCPPETTPTEIVIESDDQRPLLFQWGGAEPVINDNFQPFRDSVISSIGEDQKLEITGLYYRDEDNMTGQENIGLARATQIKKLFADKLQDSKLALNSDVMDVSGDMRNKLFKGFRLRTIKDELYVKDIDDHAVIYFPFNSTRNSDNSALDVYLQDVADRMLKTGERLELTGHTDDLGTNESNYYLGLWRAESMKYILVNKGVSPELIQVASKGEIEPIATNRTSEGKRKNRRVELKLFKE